MNYVVYLYSQRMCNVYILFIQLYIIIVGKILFLWE